MCNTKPKYPNSECGDCPVRLAIGGVNGITATEARERYCFRCRIYTGDPQDCDWNCLECDYYNPDKGCIVEESKDV